MPPARPAPTGPALAAGLLLLLGACGDPQPAAAPPAPRSFSAEALGVRLRILLLPGESDATLATAAAFAEAQELERLVNLWSADSALSRWNAHSRTLPAGPMDLDPGLAELLKLGLEVAGASDGALDPTVGPALRELGFYGQEATADLDDAARESWRGRVGHDSLTLADTSVERGLGAMELDLSSLAKGAAADRMAGILASAGVPSALVEVGSSVVAFGPGPDGTGWPLELPHPDGPRTLWLLDEASSTSGRTSITLQGRHAGRSHLLDPRHLAPVDHRTEMVVVRGPGGAVCDAWSTALLVMGLDELETWWPERPAEATALSVTVYAAPADGTWPPEIVELP